MTLPTNFLNILALTTSKLRLTTIKRFKQHLNAIYRLNSEQKVDEFDNFFVFQLADFQSQIWTTTKVTMLNKVEKE